MNASQPWSFSEACVQFDDLLRSVEMIANGAGFIGMYLAAALIDPLACAALPPNKKGGALEYRHFVEHQMPNYSQHKFEIYHVVRCGLLHGSRLDIALATPPVNITVIPVELTDPFQAPSIINGTLIISVPHFMQELRAAFTKFSNTVNPLIIRNFPQRFRIKVRPETLVVDRHGIITVAPTASGGP